MIGFTLLIGTAVLVGIWAGLAVYNAIRPLPLPERWESKYGSPFDPEAARRIEQMYRRQQLNP